MFTVIFSGKIQVITDEKIDAVVSAFRYAVCNLCSVDVLSGRCLFWQKAIQSNNLAYREGMLVTEFQRNLVVDYAHAIYAGDLCKTCPALTIGDLNFSHSGGIVDKSYGFRRQVGRRRFAPRCEPPNLGTCMQIDQSPFILMSNKIPGLQVAVHVACIVHVLDLWS
jgi:hypothetical protein